MLKKNDEYFNDRNNLQACYWAGFLAADGYLVPKENKLGLELSIKDIDHMRQFVKDLEWTGQVRTRQRTTELCRIQIGSCKNIIAQLESHFGFRKDKTHNLCPPNLTGYSKWAFIIGYIDGDGCVSLDKKDRFTYTRLTITSASPLFLSWIANELSQFGLGTFSGINVIYSGKNANAILDFLLTVPVSRLDRKWNIRGATALEIGKKDITGDNNPNMKIPQKDYFHLFNLRKQGYTQQQIADEFGVSQTSISRILKNNDNYVDLEESS